LGPSDRAARSRAALGSPWTAPPRSSASAYPYYCAAGETSRPHHRLAAVGMRDDRPVPEQPPDAAGARDPFAPGFRPAPAKAAATLILLRGGAESEGGELEVLLVQRNPGARFMPGVWVFPGGGV